MTKKSPHLSDGEWKTFREPKRSSEGYLKPGYRAKLAEDVDKETVHGDIVFFQRFMHDEDRGSMLYVPKSVVEDVADQLFEVDYGGNRPTFEDDTDQIATERP